MTVGELTAEHYGWVIVVDDPRTSTKKREIQLVSHRAWSYEGKGRIGLVDQKGANGGAFIGTEAQYSPDTPCQVLYQFSIMPVWRKRARKKAS